MFLESSIISIFMRASKLTEVVTAMRLSIWIRVCLIIRRIHVCLPLLLSAELETVGGTVGTQFTSMKSPTSCASDTKAAEVISVDIDDVKANISIWDLMNCVLIIIPNSMIKDLTF